jgi:UDP-N-acetylglucosamine:LPS N-acetylglucosamine transferase
VPTLLHEQNAVMGRANRFLAKRAARLALSFEQVKFADMVPTERRTVTGNPVRPEISAIGDVPYIAPRVGEKVQLFVMGGSLGARVFGKVSLKPSRCCTRICAAASPSRSRRAPKTLRGRRKTIVRSASPSS